MIKGFSKKQLELMSWWCPQSSLSGCDGIICDGAVRSGKTLCMALSFFSWSMARFDGENFAICGKTIGAVRRNLLIPVRRQLEQMGVLFDEVALQDRGFVEQAVARCSVEGSKFWFNCNPEYPGHWFYTDWIQKRQEKNLAYLHFRMEDNPSLSQAMRRRYESLYSGGFYRRFVLGEWADLQGLVYPMFSQEKHVVQSPPACTRFWVSCDYGTRYPCSMGLWGERGGRWYRLREYYYDSRREGRCRTDEEHYRALEQLCADSRIEGVIVDPSAASFIECVRRHGKYRVFPADNRVLAGIQKVSALLQEGKLLFSQDCADSIREFSLYRWSEEGGGEKPVKENDHAMDEIRYFAMQVCGEKRSGFFAIAQQRGTAGAQSTNKGGR